MTRTWYQKGQLPNSLRVHEGQTRAVLCAGWGRSVPQIKKRRDAALTSTSGLPSTWRLRASRTVTVCPDASEGRRQHHQARREDYCCSSQQCPGVRTSQDNELGQRKIQRHRTEGRDVPVKRQSPDRLTSFLYIPGREIGGEMVLWRTYFFRIARSAPRGGGLGAACRTTVLKRRKTTRLSFLRRRGGKWGLFRRRRFFKTKLRSLSGILP